jgi:hypothetical protein
VSAPSELIWSVKSLAELRKAGRLRALGQALDSEPQFAPTHAGRSFPPKRRLKGGLAKLLASYEGKLDPAQPEMWFFAHREPPDGDGDIYVADDRRLRLGDMPHTVDARFSDVGWFKSPERLIALSAYLTRVAESAGAFYANCASSEVLDQRSRLLERNAGPILGGVFKAGRVPSDLHRELPDVFWWNYFGPAFVAKWSGRLDGLGVRQERTRSGARVIWATETPFVFDPKVKKLGAYPWKRQFYAALGEDTFMHEGQEQKPVGEAVPEFNEHRRAAGAEPVEGDRKGGTSSAVMPRIAKVRETTTFDDEAEAEILESPGLVLHLSGENRPSLDAIAKWLRQWKEITVPDDLRRGAIIVYRNPATGVRAGFEVEDPADLDGRLPAGSKAVGLGFRLPWLRPSFFAREALPVLVELAERFGLVVAADEADGGNLEPRLASSQGLVEVWQAGNRAAVRRDQSRLPYMSPERSDRWWRYQLHKAELHRRLGEDVFVPTLVAVAEGRRTDDLRLHITWTDAVPLVLPECDLVTLLDGKRPAEFKIRGTVPYGEVRRALDPYLDSIAIEGLGAVSLLKPTSAREARTVFFSLRTRPTDHVEVEPAGWVDVSLDNQSAAR